MIKRTIGVLNYKGGTGKTTTVVNLASGLAERGERVLCVDLDAQGGLATYLDVHYTYSLSHLLLGQAELAACIVRARDNLDIIACDRTLFQAEGELWRLGNTQQARYTLTERMRGVEGYDYVIFDFSPSISLVSENGLLYVKEILVPVATNYLALVGTRQVIDTLKAISQLPGHQFQLSLIIPTFFQGRLRKDREVMRLLRQYFSDKVAHPIRSDVKLSEAPGHGMTIYEYAANSNGAADYRRLVERVTKNG
ncbi:MAG: ParA family protein [Anaerolineae bacterium]|nr:ParA family protein [Anaerolineae bacterium]